MLLLGRREVYLGSGDLPSRRGYGLVLVLLDAALREPSFVRVGVFTPHFPCHDRTGDRLPCMKRLMKKGKIRLFSVT